MSSKTPSVVSLEVLDYTIFVATLTLSILIGIYHGCFGKKQATVIEYLLAGKNMRIIPIGISVAVSHFSGSTLIVLPADVYRYGASVWLFTAAYVVMSFLAVFIYMPVFFKLQFTSVYEYLERRFDRKAKILGLIFYVLADILMFPVLVYTPSLTVSTATGVSVQLVALILSGVCIFYTTLGGLKTVIWTDFLQFVIILLSLLIIYVVGLERSGGFLSVWKTGVDAERLQVFNFTLDPTARDSFWGYTLGGGLALAAKVVAHQTGVQKLLALPKFKDCVLSIVYTVISLFFVHTLCTFIGLEVYTMYKNCDPLSSGQIKKHDQLIPFFVTDMAANLPGLRGLLIAALCSASLSSMSSDLNAMSVVIYKDIVCVFLKGDYSERRVILLLKSIAVAVGILCTCLVFIVDRLGEILSLTMTILAITKGPLLGMFTLGILFARANSKGAFYGTLGGFLAALGLVVPSRYYQMKGLIKFPTKPLSTTGCGFTNQSLWLNVTSTAHNSTLKETLSFQPHPIFKISFYYYTLFGAVATIIIGLVISYLTKAEPIEDQSLLSPFCRSCSPKRSTTDGRGSYSSVTGAVQTLQK